MGPPGRLVSFNGMPKGRPHGWFDRKLMIPAIRDTIESLRIVDTHEHLVEEATRLKEPNNLSRFFQFYAFDDVATAGIDAAAQKRFFEPDISAHEQWKIIRGVWPVARNTGYLKSLRISIRELYGIDDLADGTIGPLMDAVAARNKPGVLDWILRQKCRIECCLVDDHDPCDMARRTALPGLFLFDVGVGQLLTDDVEVKAYEKQTGLSCGSLADWTKIIDWYFARWGGQAVAIKNVSAYWRTLRFDEVAEPAAAAAFDKWLLRRKETTAAERKAVQDFVFHYCIRKAIDYGLPVKIHTGYHAGHDYMDMDIFQPRALANLFRKYPEAKFDLFHIGYPAWGDVLALAKHYSNVWADMCWAWIIDPEASLGFARQALASIPLNKVLGFGGDYGFADVVYGHSRLAREGIAVVLSEAVRQGRLNVADAKTAARMWLRENAMELFRVEKKRSAQAFGQPAPLSAAGS